ncbi:MAG: peptide chain release factor N(5)-glutamine methyltransferase [Alistipes sp.]|nr:peptide chain release factor N(5)-glutamine methyltransferase [Alistipes sp.]
MATRREIFMQLVAVAGECYPEVEERQIAEMILLSKGHISRNDLFIEPNVELQIPELESIFEELRAWRPVQYIVGRAEFVDMELAVREGVLIPRPETEELVDWVAREAKSGAHILDVCTGSGCIAIALKRMVKNSEVWAMDLSREALAIARENGAEYAPDVRFVEGDALSDFSSHFEGVMFDVIVSNPPYIPDSDRQLMRPNVTEHEPDMALFVEDGDPLVFYRAIARCGRKMLNVDGRLYFEIYELLVEEMMSMLEAEGYADIVVREDFRGKPRMICARVSSIAR